MSGRRWFGDPAGDARAGRGASSTRCRFRHFYVAGAINGDDGPTTGRWFCAIGSNEELDFSSVQAARRFLQDTCPDLLG